MPSLQKLEIVALLFKAAEENNFSLLQWILQQGQYANTRDRFNRTALHWFAWHGNEQAVLSLLNQGANTNIQNWVGWTPIFCAIYRNHFSVVQMLLNVSNLDIHSTKAYDFQELISAGSTVHEVAKVIGNEAIINLLKNRPTAIIAEEQEEDSDYSFDEISIGSDNALETRVSRLYRP